ncbi:Metallothionein, partial [Pseudomonas fluorescens]
WLTTPQHRSVPALDAPAAAVLTTPLNATANAIAARLAPIFTPMASPARRAVATASRIRGTVSATSVIQNWTKRWKKPSPPATRFHR